MTREDSEPTFHWWVRFTLLGKPYSYTYKTEAFMLAVFKQQRDKHGTDPTVVVQMDLKGNVQLVNITP